MPFIIAISKLGVGFSFHFRNIEISKFRHKHGYISVKDLILQRIYADL